MKLDEALLALKETGEPAFELNGQCFDSLVQAIENVRAEVAVKLDLAASRAAGRKPGAAKYSQATSRVDSGLSSLSVRS